MWVCLYVCLSVCPLAYLNKSSAIAEMGHRLATVDVGGRKVWVAAAVVSLSVGAGAGVW